MSDYEVIAGQNFLCAQTPRFTPTFPKFICAQTVTIPNEFTGIPFHGRLLLGYLDPYYINRCHINYATIQIVNSSTC
ncbi:hypothetical protein [Glutamicibacter sp. 2E12]|uniref:hypothetical protein n=1 Tax=Glutamicibacter sp. 2E12 TaxID=3416181 RepID=UPI003CF5021A